MSKKSVSVLYFSPTGTTGKIVRRIAQSLEADTIEYIDFTRVGNRGKKYSIDSDIVVMGAPVYEEYLPELFTEALSRCTFKNQPAIGLSVYGNIGYGLTLKEFYTLMKEKGLKPAVVGAFVGEHSFSTPATPLAAGRPNQAELDDAAALAELFQKQYSQDKFLNSEETIPGKLPLMARILPKNSAKLFTKTPAVNGNCTGCKGCIKKCPAGAIDDTLAIDENRCLRCFACVKCCPVDGRRIIYKKGFLVKRMLGSHNRVIKENLMVPRPC